MQIRQVTMVAPGQADAVVDIVEVADAMFQGRKQDSFEQDVSIKYRLVRLEQGWRISNSLRVGHLDS
jgi:hypothetical protein